MEESEKRRERLQALRMEAASQISTPSPGSGSYTSSATPPSAHLSNPLAHPGPPPPPAAEATPPLPRFDFYTDPMSAFSASKRRSGSGSGSGRGRGRGAYNPHEGFASPMGSTSPMSHPSSNRPSAGSMNYHTATPAHQFHGGHSPDQSPYEMQLHVRQRSPIPFGSPFSGPGTNPVMSPGAWDRSGGSSGHRFPPSSSRGGYMSPGFGRGGIAMNNSGRDSPHSFSGRGNTWRSGGSPSPGLTGGRGRGFHGNGHLNIKSMVKDPWRKLQPIVGNILVPRAGWLPKSLTLKKPKTEESSDKFNSQSSLAECLALSFEDAINDANA